MEIEKNVKLVTVVLQFTDTNKQTRPTCFRNYNYQYVIFKMDSEFRHRTQLKESTAGWWGKGVVEFLQQMK